MTTSVTASPHFRSSASSHGPSADDCVRWLHHQHGATDQPEAQTAELNFCMRAGVCVCVCGQGVYNDEKTSVNGRKNKEMGSFTVNLKAKVSLYNLKKVYNILV